MKYAIQRFSIVTGLSLAVSLLLGSSVAMAAATTTNTTSNTKSATVQARQQQVQAQEQQHLQNIISRGNQEITRRVGNLQRVESVISGTTKLTTSDQTTLKDEVTGEITGLTSLKTQLDSATSASTAVPLVQDIFNEYRVYALVLPKIRLVRVADDEQVTEAKLTSFAQVLQTRLTQAQKAGKNVIALQADLTSMTSQTSAAQTISGNIESSVINLQPSDYNSNHEVLSGDMAQLKTAYNDEQAARNDAQSIIQGLE